MGFPGLPTTGNKTGYNMQVPLEITFHGFPHSDAVETRIREKAAKLEQFYDHIISCRVAVELEHQHQHQGKLFHVRIDLSVPGKHLVVSREHHDKQAHEDMYVALRDAFDVAKRQLEEYVRIQRGEVKKHYAPALTETP
jgi:ribosomal subunit interface protein